MAKEFQWIKPDGTWSTHRPIEEVMQKANEVVDKHLKLYKLNKDHKTIRHGVRRWILRGLRKALSEGSVGPIYRIWGDGAIQFVCRETVPALHVIDTNGNAKTDYCWSFGKAKYPDCLFLGAYVCKHIVGSYTMSQHSYGNAVDFGRDNMDELWDLAHYLVSNAGQLYIAHLIVGDRIWSPSSGWSYYGGQYHYHVHCDFTPQYSGSCGVKG